MSSVLFVQTSFNVKPLFHGSANNIIITMRLTNVNETLSTKLIQLVNPAENNPKISCVPVTEGGGKNGLKPPSGDLHCITCKEFLQLRKKTT